MALEHITVCTTYIDYNIHIKYNSIRTYYCLYNIYRL